MQVLKDNQDQQTKRPYGVRGFLAFWIFVKIFLGPLINIGSVSLFKTQFEAQFPGLNTLSWWNIFVERFYILTAVETICYGIVALNLKYRLTKASLTMAKFISFTGPILSFLSFYLICENTPIMNQIFRNSDFQQTIFKEVLVNFIWGTYFTFSKRCKNTYR